MVSLIGAQRLLPLIVVMSCGTNLHKVEVVIGMLAVIDVHPASLVQVMAIIDIHLADLIQHEPGEQLDH